MEHELVTPEDQKVLIQIVIWILFIFSGLTVIARTGTKFYFAKTIFGFDDWSIHTAIILALGQSVAVYMATTKGLGTPMSSLLPDQVESIEKARYAASLLFSLAFCSARLSILGLLRLIRPGKSDDRLIFGLGGIVCLWAFVSEIITAMQCHPPETWDSMQGHCIDQISWLLTMDIVNIVIDILLIILPVSIIWKVQVTTSKKLSLIFFFGVRITVVAALICDAAFQSQLGASTDLTLDAWRSTVATQSVQCLSITTACTLYLKPFLETLQSGFIRGDDLRRRNPSLHGYASFNSMNLSNRSKRRKSSAISSEGMPAMKQQQRQQQFGNINNIVAHEFPSPSSSLKKHSIQENGSQDDQQNVIVADTTITVEYEQRRKDSLIRAPSTEIQ